MESAPPPDSTDAQVECLALIRELVAAEEETALALGRAVIQARQEGVTWDQIAAASDVPTSTAYSRWRGLDSSKTRQRTPRLRRQAGQAGPGLEL